MSGVHESPDGTMLAFVAYDRDVDAEVLRVTDRSGAVLSEGLYEGGEFVRAGVDDIRWIARFPEPCVILRGRPRDESGRTQVDSPRDGAGAAEGTRSTGSCFEDATELTTRR